VSYLVERREEEKERRRLEIIEAAERIYGEKGWDLLTMDQVARAARLSRTLVYVYFQDKDDLLLAIAGRGIERLAERFRQAAEGSGSGLDKIEAMGRAYIAFGTEFPHYFDAETRFQAGHKLGEDRPCEAACAEAADKVHNVLVETLRLGMADGSVRSGVGDPDIVSVALWAFSHGLVQIVTAKGEALAARGLSAEQLTEESIRMIQDMLAARPTG
jgi:TetR/AcrR family transcriptional regulator